MIRRSMIVAIVALSAGVGIGIGGAAFAQVQSSKPVLKASVSKVLKISPTNLQASLQQPALTAALARGVPKPLSESDRLKRMREAMRAAALQTAINLTPPALITLTPNNPQSGGAMIVTTFGMQYTSTPYTFSFTGLSLTVNAPSGGVYWTSVPTSTLPTIGNNPGIVVLRFPTIAGKIHVVDCTVDGVELAFARPLADGSLDGQSVPIEAGHALQAFNATAARQDVWVVLENGAMFYGCQITRVN